MATTYQNVPKSKIDAFVAERRAAGNTDAQIRIFLASKGITLPKEIAPVTLSAQPQGSIVPKDDSLLGKVAGGVTSAFTGAQKFLEKTVPSAAEGAGRAIGGKIGGEFGSKLFGDVAHDIANVPGNLGTIAGAAAGAIGAGVGFETQQRFRESPILGTLFAALGASAPKNVVGDTAALGQTVGEVGGRMAPLSIATGQYGGAIMNAALSIPLGYSAWKSAKSGKIVPTKEDLATGNLFDSAATAIPLFALSALGVAQTDKLLPFGLEKKFASPEIKAIAYSTQTAKSEFGDLLDDSAKAEADTSGIVDDTAAPRRGGFGPGAMTKGQIPDDLAQEYSSYQDAAKASFRNPYKEAPWQIAGDKADDAVGELRSLVRIYGKAKGDILAKVGETEVKGLSEVQNSFKQSIADRLGLALELDDAGNATFSKIEGKIPKVTPGGAEAKFLADVWDNSLGYLDDVDTVQYTDEAVDAIQSRIAKASPSGTGVKGFVVTGASPIDDNATAIAKSAAADLNKALYAAADPTYKEINTLYSIFRNVHDKLSKALGPEGSRAENLMVRTFSRTGGATRQLFKDVQTLTGRDLIKEATFAKAAMEEVGDLRAFGLPETIVGDIAQGKPGLAGRMMEKIFGAISRPLRRAGDKAVLRGNPGPGAMGSGDPLPFVEEANAAEAVGGTGAVPAPITPDASRIAARVTDDILASSPEQIAILKEMIADGRLPAAFGELLKFLGK